MVMGFDGNRGKITDQIDKIMRGAPLHVLYM